MPFNPVQSILEGQRAGDEMHKRELQQRIAQQARQQNFDPLNNQDFREFQVSNPQASKAVLDNFMGLGKERQKAFFADGRKLNNLLRADDAEGSLSLIDNRIKEGMRLAEEQGIPFDPSDTLEIRDDILAGPEGIARARNKLDALEQTSIDTGFFKGGRQEKRTATSKDFDRFQGFIAKAKESGLPEDEVKATQFGRRAGFIRETEQESADIKVNAAERKEVAKFNVKRKQGFIESGIDAADSTANIRRSLDLLKNVETGGFDNIALKLKSAFGVEGANELELSNNLGKSVLQQLKPLFGSAFTVQEGNKLERISAKFGSSTEANIRLLNQMLKISERGARRGLAAAEDQGDAFTADEIRKSLAFKLNDKDVSSDTPPQQSNTPPPSTSGFKILSIE